MEWLYSLPTGASVSDLIYRPLETRLVSEARAAGYEAQGGLPMFVASGGSRIYFLDGMSTNGRHNEAGFKHLQQAVTQRVQHGLV